MSSSPRGPSIAIDHSETPDQSGLVGLHQVNDGWHLQRRSSPRPAERRAKRSCPRQAALKQDAVPCRAIAAIRPQKRLGCRKAGQGTMRLRTGHRAYLLTARVAHNCSLTVCRSSRHATGTPHTDSVETDDQQTAIASTSVSSRRPGGNRPELAAASVMSFIAADGIELIASENIVSAAVLEAQGRADQQVCRGIPGRRYYGGCVYVEWRRPGDRCRQAVVRLRLRQRAAASAPRRTSGVLRAAATGDTILGMSLAAGGT